MIPVPKDRRAPCTQRFSSRKTATSQLGWWQLPPIAAVPGIDILLVSLAALLWSTVGIANGLMSDLAGVDAALCALARTALGGISLLLIAKLLSIPWQGTQLPWQSLGLFAAASAVFQTCFFVAFAKVGVTVTVAVTVCGSVILVATGGAIWNRKTPALAASVAIVAAIIGVMLTLFGEGGDVGVLASMSRTGVVALLSSTVMFAVVCAAAGMMARDLHPLYAAGLGLSAAAGLLLLSFLVQGRGLGSLTLLASLDLAILVYTGVVGTGLAYLAFVSGFHRSRSAAVGIAPTLIEPCTAALLAALILHERLAPMEAAGCVLMTAAMVPLYLCSRRVSS